VATTEERQGAEEATGGSDTAASRAEIESAEPPLERRRDDAEMPAASAHDDAELGSPGLEQFEIGEVIARGGMGTIHRGRNRRTKQQVAIKRLELSNATGVARFEREIQILRRLEHPNIVRIYGWSVEQGQHQIVMEYVAGGSLRDHLDRQPRWPIDRALRLVVELCDGLAHVHRVGVIHRDIKPENVLIGEDGTPRLADFGVSKLRGHGLTATGMVLGTLAYMSPEALWGFVLDARADVWGLGVMLFEMLAGERPFKGDAPGQCVAAILHQKPRDLEAILPGIPRGVVDLIGRMLEKDRERRTASARQVGAEAEALLTGVQRALIRTEVLPSVSAAAVSPDASADKPASCPHNLPADLTPFVGREQEVAHLLRLAASGSRLITVLGPGGMGKSRLALEVCRRLAGASHLSQPQDIGAGRFADGVFLVELAHIDTLDQIVTAIADAVGYPFHPHAPPRRQLVHFLREKELLLLLDNFEHVLSGVPIVHEILLTAPAVCIVATSRERLGLSGEAHLVLDGMTIPDAERQVAPLDCSAIRLFIDCARRVKLGFDLNRENTEQIARLCSMVEGSPLGITLAASWVGMLPLFEIESEMSRSLDFLNAELSDTSTRHRSMRAVFEHSWRLLEPDQRVPFSRLAVFRGGFSRSAASTVAGTDLRTLGALTRKSLIRARPDGGRYEIHELLRQYAEGKLELSPADHEQTRDRHALHYTEFLVASEGELRGPRPRPALDAIEAELGNVRSAWRWLHERGRVAEVRRATEALCWYYDRKGSCREAEDMFRAAAESLERCAPDATAANRGAIGDLLCLQAYYLERQGRRKQARNLVTRALDLLSPEEHPRERALALMTAACAKRGHDSALRVIELAEQSIALLRTVQDRWGLARVLALVGPWLYEGGAAVDKADACLRESIEIQQDLVGSIVFPLSLAHLGFGRVKQGRFEEGRDDIASALAIAEQLQDVWSTQVCLRLLAHAERSRGDYRAAEDLVERNLTLARRYGSETEQRWTLLTLGELRQDQDRWEEASTLLTTCRSFEGAEELFVGLVQVNQGIVARRRGEHRRAAELFEQSHRTFEKLGISWAAAVALDGLGCLASDMGRHAEAKAHFEDALRIAWRAGRKPLAAQILAGMAGLFAATGRKRSAVELLAALGAYDGTEHATRSRRIEPQLARLASELPLEEFAESSARGATSAIDAIAAELVS
jgi:predicted ATPase